MKKLRNIGIYYIALTLLSLVLSLIAGGYLFIPLLPIVVLGIVFLLVYLILKKRYKKTHIPTRLSAKNVKILYVFLLTLPFLFYVFVFWYTWRPYKQTVILPENYQGVVAIQYNKPNGQEKKWIGGFLGIGGSRLIQVDSTGIAETQFKFHNNAIPFLGIKQSKQNEGGLKIYYEDDLLHEIVPGFDAKRYTTLEKSVKGRSNIYMTWFNYYPLMIFVLTKPENYHHYFMTEEEIEAWAEQKQKESNSYVERPRHKLNTKYEHYYQFKEYYYNKLNKR